MSTRTNTWEVLFQRALVLIDSAIATFSPVRSAPRPDVPTTREQGLDMAVRVSHGLWGPPGLPGDLVAKLNATIRKTLRTPQVAERIRNASLLPVATSPEDVVKDCNNEVAYYREAAALIGYQPQ